MNVQGSVDPGKAVMFAYAGISIGDVAIGFISQWMKSRKKAVYLFYGLTIIGIAWFFNMQGQTVSTFYADCALLGFATGFWAMFVTMAAEQFGTNIRATVATTVPNMVRGSLKPGFIAVCFHAGIAGIPEKRLDNRHRCNDHRHCFPGIYRRNFWKRS